MSTTLIIYAIIAIAVLIALGWCVRQIRFLWSKTPEEVAEDRLNNRKSFWNQWFSRKKPVITPEIPTNPNQPVEIPVAKRKRIWDLFKKNGRN